MKCPSCNSDNREGVRFCEECGAKLEVKCPNCSAKIPLGKKFCGECGHKIIQPDKPPKIEHDQPLSYTPKYLADKILNIRNTIEGERKLVTVLFADVANYTAISEKLSPEDVHQIMDTCFHILMDEIHRFEGTINQFTGDGVMVLFGAPVAHEDHAQRACYSALSIQKALINYREDLKKRFGVDFKMRIGLNSGPVVVGTIGDDLRMDYTALGDTTNLAARMEDMANPGSVMVSTNTYKMARDFFVFETIGKVPVKGKDQPHEVYELITASKIETRIEASSARGLTKFVGRRPEMQVMKTAFEKAKSGSGQVVGIVGEAGVGKSRILLEVRNMLSDEEINYLEGRCLHYGGAMVYLPILDILRSYFAIKEGEREFVIKKNMKEKVLQLHEKLKNALPPFQDLLSLKIEDEAYLNLEPQQKRERTFEALRDLFVRASRHKPLVIAVEDLHWIDKTSEEFLDYLVGWLANAHILLILLYRPECTHLWGSKSYYTKIGVGQLSTPTSVELVQSILEGGEVVPELKELILHRSGGNPLFMEEFTHSLIENGTIQKKEHQYVLSRKASDIDIPDTIQGIISARIDRLEENLKRTMQVASVIGRDFAFRILQTITGMKEELKSHLTNLQGLEFIYEKRLFPELEYIFKHILTQEIAYNSLLTKRRKEIHEKIGKAIETIYTERLEKFYEMLAYHYSKSENLQKAADYSKLSGIRAVGKHSPIEAFHYYEEALKILKQLPESVENKITQIEVCLLSYVPAITMGLPDESLQMFQEATKLSKEIEDEKSLVHSYGMICIFYWARGESFHATKYGEKGFEIAKRTQDISIMAPLAMDLSHAYEGQGLYHKIVNILSDVLNLLEEKDKCFDFISREVAIYPSLCSFYGYALGALGNFKEGEVFCKKGLHIAVQIGEFRSLAYTELYNGLFYYMKGGGELTVEHFKNCIKYSEEAKWYLLIGYAFWGLGLGQSLLGDYKNALKNIEKGIKIVQDIGLRLRLSYLYCSLSLHFFDLGEYEKALSSIDEALLLAQKNNEKDSEGLSRIWLGRILVKTDPNQFDKAEESIFKGITILEELRLKPSYSRGYLYLGEFYSDIDRKDKAQENLKKAERMFQEMGMDYWLTKTREALSRL